MTELPGYDRWLAGYRRHTTQVWCSNRECDNSTGPTDVLFQSEYGQGWLEPDECPKCGSHWQQEPPDED